MNPRRKPNDGPSAVCDARRLLGGAFHRSLSLHELSGYGSVPIVRARVESQGAWAELTFAARESYESIVWLMAVASGEPFTSDLPVPEHALHPSERTRYRWTAEAWRLAETVNVARNGGAA